MISSILPLRHARTGGSNQLVDERAASAGVPHTKNEPVPRKLPFSWELIKYVGAPTFWSAAARRRFHGSQSGVQ